MEASEHAGESSKGAHDPESTTTSTTQFFEDMAQPTTPSKPIPARPIRMLSEISLDNLLFPSSGGGGSYNGCLRSRTSSPSPKPKASPSNLLMLQMDELDNVVKRKKGGTLRPKVVIECEPLVSKVVTPSTPDPSEKILDGRKRRRIKEDPNLFTLGEGIPYDLEVQNEIAVSPLAIQCSYGDAMMDGTLIPEIFMGNDGSEWTEEKQILLGRVESFMSAMKLIQGDRQCSRWKGSVVDSVAGAFLTQNVSDKLSSSAFMSLAAKYPIAKLARGQGTRSNRAINESSSSCMMNKTKNATVSQKRQKEKVIKKEYIDIARKIKLKSRVDRNKEEGLRKSLIMADEASGNEGQRDERSEDALDWSAVHDSPVSDISEAIELRGMNNKLATRIKIFLKFLKDEYGSFSLEWLRGAPPQIAKYDHQTAVESCREFLLSIRGLGLKSVECIRLLTLQHVAFPVDVNVARIVTRLGWVPLQPLPEGVQFHLLQEYPAVDSIQKYLWERLCFLGNEKLNELHFQMITFGKVICTKKNPNCNACPLRAECKHFSSKFTSEKLGLSGRPKITASQHADITGLVVKANLLELVNQLDSLGPIVICPPPPPPPPPQVQDIEDLFLINELAAPNRFNTKAFLESLRNLLEENDISVQEDELADYLSTLASVNAFLPVENQRNYDYLRTQHFVYELPDSHSLLEGLDEREKDDKCPYLLVTRSRGDTENSSEVPEEEIDSVQGECQTLLGTFLIPCRTATRGIFPLDGTYFQNNEVFADHATSLCPIKVSRKLIEGLPKKNLYCGTSVTAIYIGLSIEEIVDRFWRGYICLRGFNRRTREPKDLPRNLHITKYSKRTEGESKKRTVGQK